MEFPKDQEVESKFLDYKNRNKMFKGLNEIS